MSKMRGAGVRQSRQVSGQGSNVSELPSTGVSMSLQERQAKAKRFYVDPHKYPLTFWLTLHGGILVDVSNSDIEPGFLALPGFGGDGNYNGTGVIDGR